MNIEIVKGPHFEENLKCCYRMLIQLYRDEMKKKQEKNGMNSSLPVVKLTYGDMPIEE